MNPNTWLAIYRRQMWYADRLTNLIDKMHLVLRGSIPDDEFGNRYADLSARIERNLQRMRKHVDRMPEMKGVPLPVQVLH